MSKTTFHINALWLISAWTKEYLSRSARWLTHFFCLLFLFLSLPFFIFPPLSASSSTFLGKTFYDWAKCICLSSSIPQWPRHGQISEKLWNSFSSRPTKVHCGSPWCMVLIFPHSKHPRCAVKVEVMQFSFPCTPIPCCVLQHRVHTGKRVYEQTTGKGKHLESGPKSSFTVLSVHIMFDAWHLLWSCGAVEAHSCKSSSHLLPVTLAQHHPPWLQTAQWQKAWRERTRGVAL